MREIRGNAKNIRALLGGARYAIDYYQREYQWQNKQLSELIQDLTEKFLASYEPSHQRSAVERYGQYFLGSTIISEKDGKKFIIDGQQRLTTLTLLLMHLHHLINDPEQRGQIADLIFSQKYGKKSFNLDVPERTACMEALFGENGQALGEEPTESVANIIARYHEIADQFPDELTGKALPYFADWLIENVYFVEITAYSDEDAYTIFETMNDRGLSLTPTDMLKGYLLARITDVDQRASASLAWKKRIISLQGLGKEEDADSIKSWLRSQYANSIRERKRGADPKDFDLIGTECHRWVHENEEKLGLVHGPDFAAFIEKDFDFYAYWYERLQNAAKEITIGLEPIYYNALNNFTLQYPVLLAPITLGDSESEALRKIRIASSYIDILISRRVWNLRAIDYSTMQYAMFVVMRDIRGKDADAVACILGEKLAEDTETFESNTRFRLHGMNGRQIHRILARMTDHVERMSSMPSRYVEYSQRGGKEAYEIEHIWADHPELHKDEFSHPNDFEEYRDRIGDLLLLPKAFNASYGDLPYEKKREYYSSQNLLARSLTDKCYEHNPGFLKYVRETGLPFRPHHEFKKTDLDARQVLYTALASELWNPKRLTAELQP